MAEERASQKSPKDPSLARRLVLANIGFCDRVFQEMRGAAEKASRLFNWLVEEGDKIEKNVLHRLEENESFAMSEAHIVVMSRRFEKARDRFAARVEHAVDDASLTPRAIARTAKRIIHDIAGDDLTQIKGIGPKREAELHAEGIRTFEQLAFLSEEDAEALEDALNLSLNGPIKKWRSEAMVLAGTKAAS